MTEPSATEGKAPTLGERSTIWKEKDGPRLRH